MGKRLKPANLLFGLLLVAGLAGSAVQAYQLRHIERVNVALKNGTQLRGDDYPFEQKFAAAYVQGAQRDYKRALQTYGQLLEMPLTTPQQARVQYNIANSLLLSGLGRGLNEDGSLVDDAKYELSQARIAYEQALRLDPASGPAKFNLSVLLSILPADLQPREKQQSDMELSNLPIGLP